MLAAVGALLTPLAVAPADARPGSYVVVMGDSYTTNYAYKKSQSGECRRSATAWPAQLKRHTNHPIMNVACSGAKLGNGGYNVYDEAQEVRRRGGFNANTRAVLVQLGFNSFGGGPGLWDRGQQSFPTLTGANYAQQLRALVAYVRSAAPNARIAIVGYPQVFTPGQREMCSKALGLIPVPEPGRTAAPTFMAKMQVAQKDAARRLGVRFVNLNAATNGHGVCSVDPWVNRHPFPALGETFLFAHPTPHGDAVAARTVARAIR